MKIIHCMSVKQNFQLNIIFIIIHLFIMFLTTKAKEFLLALITELHINSIKIFAMEVIKMVAWIISILLGVSIGIVIDRVCEWLSDDMKEDDNDES